MKRTSARTTSFVALGLVAVLGLGACSSDSDDNAFTDIASSNSENETETADDSAEVTTPDISVPDVSLPDGVTIPAGAGNLSEECSQYLTLFISAFAGGSQLGDLDDAIDDLQERVPDDLEDDVQILGEALGKIAEISKKYEGNPAGLYADPEALALFGDPAVTEASTNVNAWLETECPQG